MLEGIWRPAADYLPGRLFACLKSTDNLAAAIKKGGKRRRGQGEEETGEYEARMMRFNEKGWLKGGMKDNERGGIEELATGTIEWALGLSKERPSVDFDSSFLSPRDVDRQLAELGLGLKERPSVGF